MHRVLAIQEILSDIFDHCSPSVALNPYDYSGRIKATSDLAALARTCRAFKEPALDVLWRTLIDLSPLVRCVPEASRPSAPRNKFSFNRPLTQTERDTFRSYTRRIRSIKNIHCYDFLDWQSVTTFLNPPTTEPLFPNLRTLHCTYAKKTITLLHFPLPSLITLNVEFQLRELFQDFLQSFPKFSPSVRNICITMQATCNEIGTDRIIPWQNLRSVNCPQVALNVESLVHLSAMPALTQLNFALNTIFPTSTSLVFPNLRDLSLHSETLDLIGRLLSHTLLPSIRSLDAYVKNCPSRQELSSFMAAFQTCSVGHTIERLQLDQSRWNVHHTLRSQVPLLGFEDLRPCLVLSNLRHLWLDIEWNVGLTEDHVLAFASAWPKLELLAISADCGWNVTGGVTPGGLVQLLQACPSLAEITLRLDTRGYTQVPPSQSPASLGLTLPHKVSIDVVDSAIEAESVPAVTSFFCGIAAACSTCFSLHAWNGMPMKDFPNKVEYAGRWRDVIRGVDDAQDRHL